MKKTLPKKALVILVIYCLTMMLSPLLWQLLKNNDLYYPLVTLINGCGACLMIWYARLQTQDRFDQLKTTLPKEGLYLLLGLLLLFFCQWGGPLFEQLFFASPRFSANTSYLLAVYHKYPYYLLTIVIFLPVMEEFVFRKVLFKDLALFSDPLLAAFVSSLLFSLAHQDGHYLTYLLIGLVLCYVYTKTNRLRDPIIMHCLMNLTILLLA